MNRFATLILSLAFGAALQGCAITELQNDNTNAEARIRNREGELAAEQRTQRDLVAQRDQLRKDLARSEMNAAQLQAQLERMSQVNESTPASTPRQRELRNQRAQQLSDAAKQAQALDRDATLSRLEKARQLQVLKDKTRRMLDVLLQG